jgi:hypothetical protein
LSLVWCGPCIKTLWQQFDRILDAEHVGIWEIADIGLAVPESTLRGRLEACITPS